MDIAHTFMVIRKIKDHRRISRHKICISMPDLWRWSVHHNKELTSLNEGRRSRENALEEKDTALLATSSSSLVFREPGETFCESK